MDLSAATVDQSSLQNLDDKRWRWHRVTCLGIAEQGQTLPRMGASMALEQLRYHGTEGIAAFTNIFRPQMPVWYSYSHQNLYGCQKH